MILQPIRLPIPCQETPSGVPLKETNTNEAWRKSDNFCAKLRDFEKINKMQSFQQCQSRPPERIKCTKGRKNGFSRLGLTHSREVLYDLPGRLSA